MNEQETGCPPHNSSFPQKDEEGASTHLNSRQNKYASERFALLYPTKEGHLNIRIDSALYTLDRRALRDLLCFCNTIDLLPQNSAPKATCSIHPAGRGVVITMPGEIFIIPRDRFEDVARAECQAFIVYPCEVAG